MSASVLLQTSTEFLAAVTSIGGSFAGGDADSIGNCGPQTVFVDGYYRSDGTYVDGYWRSPAGSCP